MRNIRETVRKQRRQIRVVQFGEGNFLRGFADWMIDIANEQGVYDGSVAVVKPIAAGSLERFREQGGIYTVLLRGKRDGKTVEEKRVVTCVDRTVDCCAEYPAFLELARLESLQIVLSNTTEAGIVYDETDGFSLEPPRTYPGKLTRFLYERYAAFSGDPGKGLVILPVELIENNGGRLKECVLRYCAQWKLPDGFQDWIERHCLFCSTLVDRIITGYPVEEAAKIQEELGYEDLLLDTGEPFALWVIESGDPEAVRARFPLDRAGLPVVFTKDQRPYRERKVRILNGAHTSTVLAAYLAGLDTVGGCMSDRTARAFLEQAVYREISPTVRLPKEEVERFAASVFERFENPFIRHELLSISLNSVSKWKARVLPSLLDSLKQTGALPPCLTCSFAALAAFYTTGEYVDGKLSGRRGEEPYPILDDAAVLEFFGERLGDDSERLIDELAGQERFWGMDLRTVPGFCAKAKEFLEIIRKDGAAAALRNAAGQEDPQ